jgi:toxin FitB
MNLIDSCGWIEYFTNGPLADEYWKFLKDPSKIITPTIVLYEVYKMIRRERTEEDALFAISAMKKTHIIQLTESIALSAADMSLKHALPMADAIVYATAMEEGGKVVTSDAHFKNLDNVVFI